MIMMLRLKMLMLTIFIALMSNVLTFKRHKRAREMFTCELGETCRSETDNITFKNDENRITVVAHCGKELITKITEVPDDDRFVIEGLTTQIEEAIKGILSACSGKPTMCEVMIFDLTEYMIETQGKVFNDLEEKCQKNIKVQTIGKKTYIKPAVGRAQFCSANGTMQCLHRMDYEPNYSWFYDTLNKRKFEWGD